MDLAGLCLTGMGVRKTPFFSKHCSASTLNQFLLFQSKHVQCIDIRVVCTLSLKPGSEMAIFQVLTIRTYYGKRWDFWLKRGVLSCLKCKCFNHYWDDLILYNISFFFSHANSPAASVATDVLSKSIILLLVKLSLLINTSYFLPVGLWL